MKFYLFHKVITSFPEDFSPEGSLSDIMENIISIILIIIPNHLCLEYFCSQKKDEHHITFHTK